MSEKETAEQQIRRIFREEMKRTNTGEGKIDFINDEWIKDARAMDRLTKHFETCKDPDCMIKAKLSRKFKGWLEDEQKRREEETKAKEEAGEEGGEEEDY